MFSCEKHRGNFAARATLHVDYKCSSTYSRTGTKHALAMYVPGTMFFMQINNSSLPGIRWLFRSIARMSDKNASCRTKTHSGPPPRVFPTTSRRFVDAGGNTNLPGCPSEVVCCVFADPALATSPSCHTGHIWPDDQPGNHFSSGGCGALDGVLRLPGARHGRIAEAPAARADEVAACQDRNYSRR